MPNPKPKKKLFTSYFGRSALEETAVSITARKPVWFKSGHCEELAPPWQIVRDYKDGRISEATYTKLYLKHLDGCGKTPAQVAALLPEGSILLCYEGHGFCHRHIAAEWLRKGAEVDIKELP